MDNSNSSTVLVAFCCCSLFCHLSNHEVYGKMKQHDGVAAVLLWLLRCTARLRRRMLLLLRVVLLLRGAAAVVVAGHSRSGIADAVDRLLRSAEMEKTRILPSCCLGCYLDWLDCWRSCFVEFAGCRRRVESSDVAPLARTFACAGLWLAKKGSPLRAPLSEQP